MNRVAFRRVGPLGKQEGVGLGKGRGGKPNLEKATKSHQELAAAPSRWGLRLQIKNNLPSSRQTPFYTMVWILKCELNLAKECNSFLPPLCHSTILRGWEVGQREEGLKLLSLYQMVESVNHCLPPSPPPKLKVLKTKSCGIFQQVISTSWKAHAVAFLIRLYDKLENIPPPPFFFG